MQLTFLGTAAADAYPEAFCRRDNCEQASSPATLGRLAETRARDLAPGSLFDPAAQEQLNLHLHPTARASAPKGKHL